MVVIVDPRLKRSTEYQVYQQASDLLLHLFIKPKGGKGEYEGWCWRGHSSYVQN